MYDQQMSATGVIRPSDCLRRSLFMTGPGMWHLRGRYRGIQLCRFMAVPNGTRSAHTRFLRRSAPAAWVRSIVAGIRASVARLP